MRASVWLLMFGLLSAGTATAAEDCVEDDEYECVDVWVTAPEADQDDCIEDDEYECVSVEGGELDAAMVAGGSLGGGLGGAAILAVIGAAAGVIGGAGVGGFAGLMYADANNLTWGLQGIFGGIVIVAGLITGALVGLVGGVLGGAVTGAVGGALIGGSVAGAASAE